MRSSIFALTLLACGVSAIRVQPSSDKQGPFLPKFDLGVSPKWDFSEADLTQNNLGGKGPDAGVKEMRVSHFARVNDTILDMVITCGDGYNPFRTQANKLRGPFAQVNVGKGSWTNLTIMLVEKGTNTPVKVSRLAVTIWDLDHGKDKANMEHATIGPISRFALSPTTTVGMNWHSSGFYTFKATTVGGKTDNPKDPYNVTQSQLDHAVTVEIIDTAVFFLHFEVFDGPTTGRNLLISGDSMLLDEGKNKECSGYGDPHITAFDGSEYTALPKTDGPDSDRYGEFWLVKNSDVQIQARYYPEKAGDTFPSIKSLAVGGPFLDGNILIVRPMQFDSQWNGQTILGSEDSEFTVDGLVDARTDGRITPVSPRNYTIQQTLIFSLPKNVFLQIDRNNQTLAFKIFLPPLSGDVDGQCWKKGNWTVAPCDSLWTKINGDNCTGFGDPHITAFDGSQYTALSAAGGQEQAGIVDVGAESGEVWLVKSEQVLIQARYLPEKPTDPYPSIRSLAVGGPFLKGSVLVIRPLAYHNKWNATDILEEAGSSFEIPGLVSASNDPSLTAVAARNYSAQQRLLLKLPLGVAVQIDRDPMAIAFSIAMPRLEGGQDGQCGNFNSNAQDDTKTQIQSRFDWNVQPADSLFTVQGQMIEVGSAGAGSGAGSGSGSGS